jgi:hypothetical protein
MRRRSHDDELFLKYGIGKAANDPHSYQTLDLYNAPGRESLSEMPAALRLLQKYGTKVPMEEWFGAIDEPSEKTLDGWMDGLSRAKAPELGEVRAFTAEQMLEREEPADRREAPLLADAAEPIDWERHRSALGSATHDWFCSTDSAARCAEFDSELYEEQLRRHTLERWDGTLKRLRCVHSSLQVELGEWRLRYYWSASLKLFLVLLLELDGEKYTLLNWFYLEHA